MGRKVGRKPFFRKVCRAWYIVDPRTGRQVRLHEDEEKAIAKWHRMMAADPEPQGSDWEVGDIIDDFFYWNREHKSPGTAKWYSGFLCSGDESAQPKRRKQRKIITFDTVAGHLKVRDPKPHHVTKWLKDNGWKGTTANCAIRAVVRCFNWAVDEGHIEKNPIKGIKKPRATARECYIKDDEWETIKAHARGQFREFLMFAWATGARPQEIRAIEARHYDASLKAIVFPVKESKGKKYQRVIRLEPGALATIEKLVKRYPAGTLFRSRSGEPWTNVGITCAFRRLSKKVGFHVIAYAVRHTWATNALKNGVDPLKVAQLMGHRDIKLLMEVSFRQNL